MLLNALHYSRYLLTQIVQRGDTVVDATMGNGHDTVLLSQLVGERGTVYSFDIQKVALITTQKKLLALQQYNNVKLIHDSHSLIHQYVHSPITAAIFNLGYLPQGDHSITTTFTSTKLALNQLLELLVPRGMIILVLYSGHDNGVETQAILNYVQRLNQQNYNVLHYQFINQRNTPPQVVVVEKKEVKKCNKTLK